MPHGGPLRYCGRLARDVARTQGLLFAVAAFALALVSRRLAGGDASPVRSGDLLIALVSGTLLVAVLMVSGGVAGNDIKQGYYRALFSKPMAPWWYYLQRWLVGAVAVLSIPLWLALAFQLVFGAAGGLSWSLFGTVALGYLLIGGAVLLLSTVTARDWLVVFLIYFLQGRLRDVQQMLTRMGEQVPRLVDTVLVLLPPFDKVSVQAGLPHGGDLLHVLGYGTAMVGVALLIFAFRPLGSGGRA